MKSEHKTKNKTRRKKNATQKNGVPRFFRETPFDLALFNYINLSAVVFSCKIFVKFCSLSKLQVYLVITIFMVYTLSLSGLAAWIYQY